MTAFLYLVADDKLDGCTHDVVSDWCALECIGANTPGEASANHEQAVARWLDHPTATRPRSVP